MVTVRLIQGSTTTTIAKYTYVGTQTIPPAAFANNITFPGDAIATGKFIAGNFDDPFFFDAQGFGDFIKTAADPAHPFPRPAPKNPAKPLPTDAKNHSATPTRWLCSSKSRPRSSPRPPHLCWASG